jgi:hypothetical protein
MFLWNSLFMSTLTLMTLTSTQESHPPRDLAALGWAVLWLCSNLRFQVFLFFIFYFYNKYFKILKF